VGLAARALTDKTSRLLATIVLMTKFIVKYLK
jgi:hypothetical protein